MRLLNGILGTGVNKVGNVIGATWKGIAYIRQYAIPKNPNTAGQQIVREKMRIIGKLGGSVLASVVQKFWDPKAIKMSGYNLFAKTNVPSTTDIPPLKNTVLSIGPLEGTTVCAFEYDSEQGEMKATWAGAVLGNGKAQDKAVVVIYDAENNRSFVNDGNAIRNDQLAITAVGISRDYEQMTGWVFFYTGTASPFTTSPSIGEAATLKPINP
jgi:hypothetical protein